jgi:hypothetical protein
VREREKLDNNSENWYFNSKQAGERSERASNNFDSDMVIKINAPSLSLYSNSLLCYSCVNRFVRIRQVYKAIRTKRSFTSFAL